MLGALKNTRFKGSKFFRNITDQTTSVFDKEHWFELYLKAEKFLTTITRELC